MKLLLINGPPRAGKDHFAKYFFENKKTKLSNEILFERFSAPLKTSFAAITNSSYNQYFEVNYYEEHKDEIIPWLGDTYRNYQINLSEKHFKPLYGEDIFGKLFVERIWTHTKNEANPFTLAVVPDSGFDIEVEYLEKHYNIDDILLCRIHRPGFDFSNDSRNYVYPKHIKSIDVHNDSTVEKYEAKVVKVYSEFWGNGNINNGDSI